MRASIAALGNVITVENAMAKLHQVDRDGLYLDHVDSLVAAGTCCRA